MYLANLALGPSSAQTISRRAKTARATTYSVLASLSNNKLVVKSGRKNKTTFRAKHPSRIIKLLKDRERSINEQHLKLAKIIPSLEAVMKKTDSELIVRHYSGLAGIITILNEMTVYTQPKDTWRGFLPLDQVFNTLGEKTFWSFRQRLSKNVTTKMIFTTSSNKTKKKMLTTTNAKTQRKFITPKRFTSTSSLITYRDRVYIGTLGKNSDGIVIESPTITKLIEEMFDLLWEQLD